MVLPAVVLNMVIGWVVVMFGITYGIVWFSVALYRGGVARLRQGAHFTAKIAGNGLFTTLLNLKWKLQME